MSDDAWKVTYSRDRWTEIEVDGVDVRRGVRSLTIDIDQRQEPTLRLEAAVFEVSVIGREPPEWVGLAELPHAALLDALEARTGDRIIIGLLRELHDMMDKDLEGRDD